MSDFGTISFDCTITSDAIECSTLNTTNQMTIPVEDILCIVPTRLEDAPEYRLLFLENDNNISTTPNLRRIHLKTAPSELSSNLFISETPNIYRPDNHIKLHFIVSTASGTGTAKLLFSRILQPLLSYLDIEYYQVHETQSASSITDLCHSLFIPQAEAGVEQTIVVLSGDGGLCDIIDAFYNSANNIRATPNISLFPAGTGNAMASSTGLLANAKAALLALLRGKPFPVPVFAATFSHGARYVQNGQTQSPRAAQLSCRRIYGGVVASWGVHAALVADSDTIEYRKFGADRFKMAAKELLYPSDGKESHRYRGSVTIFKRNDQDQENSEQEETLEPREHMYVLATLVSNLEKDFRISPESNPLDGSFRMIRFSPLSPERAMQVLSMAYQNGQHIHDNDVMYREIEGFRIAFDEPEGRWRRVCLDGRVVMIEEGGWMEVRKEKRRLVRILL
ncbi:ATP-NAD kinase-like domain-containing protein [Aspergillus pseudoustus]|uniref:ATP-NAD kinase-like domain-containing protein n=1 Tax=Aspergillus pseudoustus TaxID=1810923 RepID=A0ABR4JBP2_9EURO